MSGTNALQCLIGLAGAAVVARALGPAGRGAINTVLLWAQLATWMATLGMGRSQVYFLGAWRQEPDKRDALFANLTVQSLVSGLGSAALACLIARVAAPELAAVWLLLLIPLQLFSDLTGNYLLGTKYYQTYNAKKLIETTLYAGTLATLAMSHRLTVPFALAASAAAAIASTLSSVSWLHAKSALHLGRPRWNAFTSSLQFGWRAHAADLPRTALNFVPQLVVTPLLGFRAFGLYSAGLSLAGLVSLASSALAAVCFAESSSLEGRPQKAAIQTNLLAAICGCGLAGGLLFLAAPVAIRVLYGAAFDESIPLARILTLWAVLSGIGSVLQHALYGCGQPLKAAGGSLGGLAITVVALLILIRPFGMYGAAWATVAGCLFELTMLAAAAHRVMAQPHLEEAIFA